MKQMNVKKQIDVTKQVRDNIKKIFRSSTVSVWRALTFNDDSDTSKRIRQYALQNGGVVMVISPETETIHDADGYMRQYFPNGAMLEVDKNKGAIVVYTKGGVPVNDIKENANIQQLYSMQEFAAEL